MPLRNVYRYVLIFLGVIISLLVCGATAANASMPGDANNDGKVDEADFEVWFVNYRTHTSEAASKGDFNADTNVDGRDYTIWLGNFGGQAGLSIWGITDNRDSYTDGRIPRYGKFEATFSIRSPGVSNVYFPYDPAPPAGVDPGTGITVNATFTDPQGNSFVQPAFSYQEFENKTINGSREWFYPTNIHVWKVRFSPHIAGHWSYRLAVTDATGTATASGTGFDVTASSSHGFLNVSTRDRRYFEYDDGTYFPALGYNLNGGDLDNVNPVSGNSEKFRVMGANGIQLTRVWISQFSIFGEAYGKWGSPNRVHQTQEPRYGIIHPASSQLTANYPGLTPPALPSGSEFYMWLEFNETVSADGTQQRFTPCRSVRQIPVKPNTDYRVRVRYRDMHIEGPRVPGQPYGFAVKTSNTDLAVPTGLCNEPTSGTVVAGSYNPQAVSADPQNPGWMILTGTLNSGSADFIPNLYLSFHNVKSQDNDQTAGHVFIDRVWLEEAACPDNGSCANLLSKPWMSMHLYINQRDAFALDTLLDLAAQHNIYLKAVMLEKNDRILQSIDFNGRPVANPSIVNFYGNRRNVTKVRWLQQAWWRYMQARWGYSPNIHSWELLNEGHDGNSEGHWDLADEFGKYMQCRVFGVAVSSVDPYQDCQYDHPNNHLVTTSFFGSSYPWQFWNNQANGVPLTFAEPDYVDQHLYASEGTTDPLQFNDSAYFSYWLSTLTNIFAPGKRKPFIRGETAWSFSGSNPLESNADGGEWLHDFIWAGVNHGGLMEHFFGGGHFTRQIYGTTYDHRPMFGTYYRFIKDIPLSNGRYADALASASHTDLRVWGQKDTVGQRAHVWIANKNHTWRSVVDGTTVAPLTGTVKIGGLQANSRYPVEWWDTYAGQPTGTVTLTTNAAGELLLEISNLVKDIAVKIGYYN